MTKDAAIHAFFSGFGLEAFPAISVPTGDNAPDFPYLTYSCPTDSNLARLGVTAKLVYRSTSYVDLSNKEREISEAIGEHVELVCDDGAVIVRKGTPWSQPMGDDSDNMIKCRILSFEFLFVTKY